MAQPTSAPFSVRLPADILERLDRAVTPTDKRNAIIVTALRSHFQMSAPIGQLKVGKTKPHVNDKGMQIGQRELKAGERLKRWDIKK